MFPPSSLTLSFLMRPECRFQFIMRSRTNWFFFPPTLVSLLKSSAFSHFGDIFARATEKNGRNIIWMLKRFLPPFILGIQYLLFCVRIHGDTFGGTSLWINQKSLWMLAQSHGRIWAFGQKSGLFINANAALKWEPFSEGCWFVSPIFMFCDESDGVINGAVLAQWLQSDFVDFFQPLAFHALVSSVLSFSICPLSFHHFPLHKAVKQWTECKCRFRCHMDRWGVVLIIVQSRHCRCPTNMFEDIAVLCIWNHFRFIYL